MKDFKSTLIASILISIGLSIFTFIGNGWDLQQLLSLKWWSIAFTYSFTLSYLNIFYFRYINKLDWKNQGLKRVFIGATGSVIITLIGYFLCELIFSVIVLQKQTFDEFIESQSFSNYLYPILLTSIISLFFHVIYFYKALQEKKVTEQKIIAGTASAKFAALKNQLDPHFLFNSLNVLTSLIEENPRMAQKFTTSLSKVYRYVLEQKDKELVTVEEELKFAKTYMTLLKLRFEDSIIFEMPEKITDPEAKVVPLSLQILLENTVKHNVVMPTKPLHIKIYEEDNSLFVENNLQPKQVIKQSSGVGLGNVKQRYALLTKRPFTVYKTDDAFIAKLPILTKKITVSTTMTTTESYHTTQNLKYQRAQEKVKKMKEFHINLLTYCIVIPFLAFLNFKTTGFDFPWVLFPMFGWGIGVLFHYMDAYDYHPILGKDWESKKIKKYMNEYNKRNHDNI